MILTQQLLAPSRHGSGAEAPEHPMSAPRLADMLVKLPPFDRTTNGMIYHSRGRARIAGRQAERVRGGAGIESVGSMAFTAESLMLVMDYAIDHGRCSQNLGSKKCCPVTLDTG